MRLRLLAGVFVIAAVSCSPDCENLAAVPEEYRGTWKLRPGNDALDLDEVAYIKVLEAGIAYGLEPDPLEFERAGWIGSCGDGLIRIRDGDGRAEPIHLKVLALEPNGLLKVNDVFTESGPDGRDVSKWFDAEYYERVR